MTIDEAAVYAALRDRINIDTGKDYISTKSIKNLSIKNKDIALEVALPYPALSQFDRVRQEVESTLRALPGVGSVTVTVSQHIVSHSAQRAIPLLPGVKNIIAVASGKGGVGKSTTAVNLALALASEGARVGLLDADIYGPSQPTMLGLEGRQPESPDGKSITPLEAHGIQTMSIGFMIDPDQPMVWRGPMVTQALMQLLNDTRWDDVDYLFIDLPPGTGDIQLTLSQKVPVTGAVIVTTPQDIALLDARKGIRMFEKVGVPILGVVENMSIHVCSNCGHEEPIFGTGGAERIRQDFNVEVLGQLPLDMGIRLDADGGKPTVAAQPDGRIAAIYRQIARKTAIKIGLLQEDHRLKFPKIVIKSS